MNCQKRVRSRSAAFTLIELLVVITIIGMLMALLLPAVQAAREAGRRATCMNNQKNISLATINFESSRRYFPGHLMNLTVGTKNLPVSWIVPLLPYLDHSDIYAEIQNQVEAVVLTNGNVGDVSATSFQKSLNILVCPSDPPPSQGAGTLWMSYVVNRGRNSVDNDPALGVCPNQIPYNAGNAASGTASSPTRVGMDYISSHDGASTTLLLSESLLTTVSAATDIPSSLPHLRLYDDVTSTWYYYRPHSEWLNATAWSNSVAGELTYGFEWSALAVARTGNATPRVSDQICSRHPGIIIASFCDGHQYSIRDDMDINTFKHIMTPYGVGYDNTAGDAPENVSGYEVFDEGRL